MRKLCSFAVAVALAALWGCADAPTAAPAPEAPTLRFDERSGTRTLVPPADSTAVTTATGGMPTVTDPGDGEGDDDDDDGDTKDGGGGLGSGN